MHRTRRILAFMAGFAITSYAVWGGWLYLFGAPTGGMKYLLLGLALAMTRLTYLWIDRRFPPRPTG